MKQSPPSTVFSVGTPQSLAEAVGASVLGVRHLAPMHPRPNWGCGPDKGLCFTGVLEEGHLRPDPGQSSGLAGRGGHREARGWHCCHALGQRPLLAEPQPHSARGGARAADARSWPERREPGLGAGLIRVLGQILMGQRRPAPQTQRPTGGGEEGGVTDAARRSGDRNLTAAHS